MKYAILDGQRREATPGVHAHCPGCQGSVLARCGERRIRHWAHRGTRKCDHWWEPETPWHRRWKDQFPAECQEVVHWADEGEKHIADVKTAHGRVIEFQHSPLHPDERRAREAFYPQMVWVVDGLRTKRGWLQFLRALEFGHLMSSSPLRYIVDTEGCALLETWVESSVPVYLDFSGVEGDLNPYSGMPVLWRIHPKSTLRRACVMPVPRAEFVEAYRSDRPCRVFRAPVASPIVNVAPSHVYQYHPQSFAAYMARKQRARSRFRF
jgi:hypothetical protein